MKRMMKLAAVLAASVAVAGMGMGCAKKQAAVVQRPDVEYPDIELGQTGSELNVRLKLLTQRTDLLDKAYPGVRWDQYLAEFNKMYPGIQIEIEGITNYADQALLRLQGGAWGDIMMIPALDMKDLPQYFLNLGTLTRMSQSIRFANRWLFEGNVYGVPSTATAQGVLYNKKVFEQAGITKIPTTPYEFLTALRQIKENTDAIPLYTNYAAGWTMGAWDDYVGGTATGSPDYTNNIMLHEKNPFSNRGDATHPYAVYKVLYDAAYEGLIEDDYTTTDWEGSKGMLNRGEIGTMVLGSWAFTQMQGAGPNPQDIGYMSFPITVDGRQYASSGPDYCFGINNRVTADRQLAALIFVKWFTERSGFSYNEGGIPIALGDTRYPDVYSAFDGITFTPDNPAVAGEEDLKNKLNADSELNVNNGGNRKVQELIEHAANHDMTLDQIMDEWNAAWTSAQKRNNVAVN